MVRRSVLLIMFKNILRIEFKEKSTELNLRYRHFHWQLLISEWAHVAWPWASLISHLSKQDQYVLTWKSSVHVFCKASNSNIQMRCKNYGLPFLQREFHRRQERTCCLALLQPLKVLAENYVSKGPISFLQMESAMCWKVLSFNMQMTERVHV